MQRGALQPGTRGGRWASSLTRTGSRAGRADRNPGGISRRPCILSAWARSTQTRTWSSARRRATAAPSGRWWSPPGPGAGELPAARRQPPGCRGAGARVAGAGLAGAGAAPRSGAVRRLAPHPDPERLPHVVPAPQARRGGAARGPPRAGAGAGGPVARAGHLARAASHLAGAPRPSGPAPPGGALHRRGGRHPGRAAGHGPLPASPGAEGGRGAGAGRAGGRRADGGRGHARRRAGRDRGAGGAVPRSAGGGGAALGRAGAGARAARRSSWPATGWRTCWARVGGLLPLLGRGRDPDRARRALRSGSGGGRPRRAGARGGGGPVPDAALAGRR